MFVRGCAFVDVCVSVCYPALAHHCLWFCLVSSSRAGAQPGHDVLLTAN